MSRRARQKKKRRESGGVKEPQPFEDAPEILKSITLRTAFIGGYKKSTVYEALKTMDSYYYDAAVLYRNELRAFYMDRHKECIDENQLLHERYEYIKKEIARVEEANRILCEQKDGLENENGRLALVLENYRKNAELIYNSLQKLDQRISGMQREDEKNERAKKRGGQN